MTSLGQHIICFHRGAGTVVSYPKDLHIPPGKLMGNWWVVLKAERVCLKQTTQVYISICGNKKHFCMRGFHIHVVLF